MVWGVMLGVERYAELKPESLAKAFEANPVAVVPWGALEWHGAHLPLGLDGLVAEAFCERLAAEAPAVLLPTMWLPVTTLPHPASLQVPASVMRGVVDSLVQGLSAAGARTVCLVTGHYAQGHMVELYRAAAHSTAEGVAVLAGSPLEPLRDPVLLDHAARWETAQLLATRPDLVSLEALSATPTPSSDAVLGEDPRLASREEGEAATRRALDAWLKWLGDPGDLAAHYAAAEAVYEPYVTRYYRGSWEDALAAWWNDRQAAE